MEKLITLYIEKRNHIAMTSAKTNSTRLVCAHCLQSFGNNNSERTLTLYESSADYCRRGPD